MVDTLEALSSIEKAKGKSIFPSSLKDPERIPTGIFPIDLAMGGGFPRGRCSVVYGSESGGKSTVCLKAVRQAQIMFPNQQHVYVDLEHTYSEDWAKKLGVDTDTLHVLVPDSAEDAIDIVESLILTDDIGILIVDSLAAMTTLRELKANAEDALPGASGIAINKMYRKVTHQLGQAEKEGRTPTVILINQIRFKIGVMFGNPETLPGGPSFNYASSMTLRLYGKDEMDKDISDSLPAYKKVTVTVKKHKVPIAAQKAEALMAMLPNDKYDLRPGEAYDWPTVLKYLKSLSLLTKGEAGGWDLTLADTGEFENFDKQEELRQKIMKDPVFGHRVRSMLITEALNESTSVS